MYGSEISLRGKLGKYLMAQPVDGADTKGLVYQLGVEGQGVGEILNALSIINPDEKVKEGPVVYGSMVSIKAPYAKERLLGIREGKLGFWRNLIGLGERWIILKASLSGRLAEEPGSRGYYVRVGDTILLQANNSDNLLSLHEGADGKDARLVNKERTGLGVEAWQVEIFGSQPLPTFANRPYLNGSFLLFQDNKAIDEDRIFPNSGSSSKATSYPPLNSFSQIIQQRILVREYVLVLSGVEGQYIRVAANEPTSGTALGLGMKLKDIRLTIDLDTADRSIANQIVQILPICESATLVRSFIKIYSRYESGTVAHALCSAMKTLMRELDLLISQLEHLINCNQLSLQKMVFLLHSTKITLKILENLVRRLKDKSGGRMLDILHSCALEQGDQKAKELHYFLLKKTFEPFLSMLSLWIFRGELRDPYKEFMIYEDTSISRQALEDDFNSRYWESRYTLREINVPKIMRTFASKALTAGKYLNVVRGLPDVGDIPLPPMVDLVYYPDAEASMETIVENAYNYSSRTLLQVLWGSGLDSHLSSLRKFFLLENGDFFIQFMDSCEEELRRDAKEVVLPRVQTLLQLAVQTSTLSNDPNREDLTCTLASHNLIQHLHLIQSAGENATDSYASLASQGLKGVEALTLDYRVGWPLSIVLSRRAITKYQLLSRLLYFSKHVEAKLLTSWKGHQALKELNLRGALGPSFCLRHRMLHFLQNFVYYMTLEVISPRAHEMKEGMLNAKDMDEVLELHEKFLDSCLKECLLASQDLLKILTKIMTTCLLFADQMKRFENYNTNTNNNTDTNDNDYKKRQTRVKAQTNFIKKETAHDSFEKMLNKFSETFDSQLKEFLEKLWTDSYHYHPQLR